MADIFVSYSRSDRSRVKYLVQHLEDQGWSVWWDSNIPVGHDFDRVIDEELGKARCVLVVWSQHSINSRWVNNEAADGQDRQILVPVLFDTVKVPLAFRSVEVAKLVDWPDADKDELERLNASVRRILNEPVGSSAAENREPVVSQSFSVRVAKRVAEAIREESEDDAMLFRVAMHHLNMGTWSSFRKGYDFFIGLMDSDADNVAGYWGALRCLYWLSLLEPATANQEIQQVSARAQSKGYHLLTPTDILSGRLPEFAILYKYALKQSASLITAFDYGNDVFLTSGVLDKALRHLESAETHDPLSTEVKLAIARRHFCAGNFDAALEKLMEGLQLWPSSVPLSAYKTVVHLGMQDDVAARNQLQVLAANIGTENPLYQALLAGIGEDHDAALMAGHPFLQGLLLLLNQSGDAETLLREGISKGDIYALALGAELGCLESLNSQAWFTEMCDAINLGPRWNQQLSSTED